MSGAPWICVVIPVYNHGLTVQSVIRGAKAAFPVIVVDDGSTDATPAVLAAERSVTVVTLPCNQGKGMALRAAFAARRPGERIFAPQDFFTFDGTRFKFFGDLDPAQARQGMGGLGCFLLDSTGRMPAGSIAIEPGENRPRFGEPVEKLGSSPSARD